jgi:hypothetical protein
MPGGNRKGPRGEGPMTGRGAGLCGGSDLPGRARRGRGHRWGRGFGWQGGQDSQPVEGVQATLSQILDRLEALESRQRTHTKENEG